MKILRTLSLVLFIIGGLSVHYADAAYGIYSRASERDETSFLGAAKKDMKSLVANAQALWEQRVDLHLSKEQVDCLLNLTRFGQNLNTVMYSKKRGGVEECWGNVQTAFNDFDAKFDDVSTWKSEEYEGKVAFIKKVFIPNITFNIEHEFGVGSASRTASFVRHFGAPGGTWSNWGRLMLNGVGAMGSWCMLQQCVKQLTLSERAHGYALGLAVICVCGLYFFGKNGLHHINEIWQTSPVRRLFTGE